MTSLKRLLDFYINSSLHVSVSVLSFCVLTAYESNLYLTTDFYVSIFCASIVGYNFVKYFGLAKFYYRSLTTRLKYIQWVSVLSLIGLGYTFCLLQNTTQLLLIFLGLITFLYAIPLGIKTPKNVRSIGIIFALRFAISMDCALSIYLSRPYQYFTPVSMPYQDGLL